jgi:hypothetical protein
MDGIPIVMVGNRARGRGISITWSPGVGAGELSTGTDAALVEVFHTLTPFDDRETLEGGSGTKESTFFLSRLHGQLDGLAQLGKHVVCSTRFNREPLHKKMD